jgi:hypothetical protein
VLRLQMSAVPSGRNTKRFPPKNVSVWPKIAPRDRLAPHLRCAPRPVTASCDRRLGWATVEQATLCQRAWLMPACL